MFQINRKLLAAELAIIQEAAEAKSLIPVLSFLLINVIDGTAHLTATDQVVAISTEVAVTGDNYSGCLPLKSLAALVRLFGDEEDVTFTPKANSRIEVKWGASKHLLPTLAADEFPDTELVSGESVTLPAATLATMLSRTAICMGTPGQGLQYVFECISFELAGKELTLAATNSRSFGAMAMAVDSDATLNALVPSTAVSAIEKLCGEGNVTVTVDSNHARFQCGSRTLTVRLVVGQFPNWRLVVPDAHDHHTSLDPEKLAASVKRACVTTREAKMIRYPLTLQFSRESLQITTQSDNGESIDSLPIACESLNGNELSIRCNGEHLLNFISCTTGKIDCLFSDDKRMIQLGVEGDATYKYITMALK